MGALNQVIIEGNVVRDVSIREKPWGTKFCVVSLAVNHYYKDRQGNFAEEVGFYDVHVFGEANAQNLVKNGKKGVPLRVIGRLKQERWKNSDGKQASRNFIVAAHVDYLKRQTKAQDSAEEAKSKEEATKNEIFDMTRRMNDATDSLTVDEEDAAF